MNILNDDNDNLCEFDENILEETLKILNSDVKKDEFISFDITIDGLPSIVKDDLIVHLKNEAKKYIINLVLTNSMKLGDFKCYFIEKEESIVWSFCDLNYKIQGKWSGNEVIIPGDSFNPLFIVSTDNGIDWIDITKNFTVQKYDILS